MRIAPLGALYHDRLEVLAAVAMESSLTTHADLRAGAVAYAIARTAAGFVKDASPEQLIDELPGDVAAVEEEWLASQSIRIHAAHSYTV